MPLRCKSWGLLWFVCEGCWMFLTVMYTTNNYHLIERLKNNPKKKILFFKDYLSTHHPTPIAHSS